MAPIDSAFSPDGRWLAYTWAPTAGAAVQVFVQAFPGAGAKYQVATRAIHPVWSPDGKELFFMPPGQLMFVRVATQPSFTFGNPVSIPVPEGLSANSVNAPKTYDIMPDGQRFIGTVNPGPVGTGGRAAPQIQVVLKLLEE